MIDFKRVAESLNANIDKEIFGTFSTTNSSSSRTLNMAELERVMAMKPKPEPVLYEVVLWRYDMMLKITRGMRIHWIAPMNMWSAIEREVNQNNPLVKMGFGSSVPIYPNHDRALELFSEGTKGATA